MFTINAILAGHQIQKSYKKSWYFFYFKSDPDPFFHETDSRIQIQTGSARLYETHKYYARGCGSGSGCFGRIPIWF